MRYWSVKQRLTLDGEIAAAEAETRRLRRPVDAEVQARALQQRVALIEELEAQAPCGCSTRSAARCWIGRLTRLTEKDDKTKVTVSHGRHRRVATRHLIRRDPRGIRLLRQASGDRAERARDATGARDHGRRRSRAVHGESDVQTAHRGGAGSGSRRGAGRGDALKQGHARHFAGLVAGFPQADFPVGPIRLAAGGAASRRRDYYIMDMAAEAQTRETRHAARGDISRGMAARRLPQFRSQVADLERRRRAQAVLPEQKDAAPAAQDQTLAVQST
jgi:hypothetical protein